SAVEDIDADDALRKRPLHNDANGLIGTQAQAVADPGEGYKAFDFVVAIAAPPPHLQRQIDLGASNLRNGHGSLRRGFSRASILLRAVADRPNHLNSGRLKVVSELFFRCSFFSTSLVRLTGRACWGEGTPRCSLRLILSASSGSGLSVRACSHWKRASRSRPTRQKASPRWSLSTGSSGRSSTARSRCLTASL